MKGLVYRGPHEVALETVEKPMLLADTDALIRVTLTTICGSDVHLCHAHIPTTPGYVLGHEYVGIVEQVGSKVSQFKPGDRVIGPAAPYCGQCERCLKGDIMHCMNGGVHGSGPEFGNLSGAQGEYMRIPYADVNLVHVPEQLEDEQVLFVGDILSTGYFAAEKAAIAHGDTVVVFGAGPVGLCAVQSAQLFHPERIILVDIDPFRLEAGLKLGATDTINAKEQDVLEVIGKLTGGKGADAVIEAAGAEITFQQAVKCAALCGRVVLVGIFGQPVSFPLHEAFMKNLRIEMGLSYLGHMKKLVKLIENGKIDLRSLITHRMSLNEVQEAFKLFEQRTEQVIKIAIRP
ncbi:alcohol dehydrogenase [Paenibacillus sp. GCM10027626]|uniref:alcohol dehydrogenase n=1 Tax=Paenibacillus sp. GCM10027626 TaxID=3273411 RepID=UPI0036360572